MSCPSCHEGVSFKVRMNTGLAPPSKPLSVSCGICNHYIGEFAQLPATFPQSSSLIPHGAESADIGKLDAAPQPYCAECGKQRKYNGIICADCGSMKTTDTPPTCKSGVEMGKVNRVEEYARGWTDAELHEFAQTQLHELGDEGLIVRPRGISEQRFERILSEVLGKSAR